MKKLISFLSFILILSVLTPPVSAKSVHVRGYHSKGGRTYVSSYHRRSPHHKSHSHSHRR
jgi:hypothetical protein